MASRNPSFPVNGVRAMLLALPAYGPCTCTEVFRVLTLVVAPGSGVCAVATDPFPLRLESGNCTAGVEAPCDGGPPSCATATFAEKATAIAGKNIFVINLITPVAF
jgi:hypothetical protein